MQSQLRASLPNSASSDMTSGLEISCGGICIIGIDKHYKTGLFFSFFQVFFIYFLERREGREKERERNTDWLPLVCAPTRVRIHNPGMCLDQESNWRPFALWNDAQLIDPHQFRAKSWLFLPGEPLLHIYQHTTDFEYPRHNHLPA